MSSPTDDWPGAHSSRNRIRGREPDPLETHNHDTSERAKLLRRISRELHVPGGGMFGPTAPSPDATGRLDQNHPRSPSDWPSQAIRREVVPTSAASCSWGPEGQRPTAEPCPRILSRRTGRGSPESADRDQMAEAASTARSHMTYVGGLHGS